VPELSGENNIKLGLLAMGFTPDEAASHVDEIADFAELNEFIHHPMRTYSSGMGARLRFAIASAKAHSVLLIDEALAVGDHRFKLKSEERIRGLRDTAGLVMIVSHSASSLRDTCERVLWIHKGELRADGPAVDVIDDYIKWAKKPGEVAVGAAASAKTAQTTTPAKAKTAPQPAQPAPSVLRRPQGRPATAPVTAVRPPRERSSTAARRARNRQATREFIKRRIVAVAISGAAILLAVGAGAGIAVVSLLP
jgi:ABC-type multidrug transport system ATPase subunit